jgi:hypothetical protein
MAARACKTYNRRMRESADMSFDAFLRMLRSKHGLRLLLGAMPPGSTLEDAFWFDRKLTQAARTPCSFLDEEFGIRR